MNGVAVDAVLRDAQPDDHEAVLRLNAASVHFLSALDGAKLGRLAGEAAYFKVAQVAGEVAAFLLAFGPRAAYESENYRWFDARYESFLYVDRIVVDAAHRGRGLARLLYGDLFAAARAGGVPSVTCEFDVDPPNPVSERFHAAFGFREVGSQRVSYADKRVSLQEAPAG